jgi:hypothetical protein
MGIYMKNHELEGLMKKHSKVQMPLVTELLDDFMSVINNKLENKEFNGIEALNFMTLLAARVSAGLIKSTLQMLKTDDKEITEQILQIVLDFISKDVLDFVSKSKKH